MGNRIGRFAVLGAALAATSTMASADVLVTQSIGAAAREYPRGTRLANDAVLTLGRGDTVTILTPQGTRQFRTPGRWRVDGRRVLAGGNLGRSNAGGIARTGVSRTGVGEGDVPARTVWEVEYNDPGPICFIPGTPVTLRRNSAAAPQAITVTRAADGTSYTLNFGETEWTKPWPPDFAIDAQSEYSISYPGAVTSSTITFLPLGVAAGDDVAVGAALLERGCEKQFNALVETADIAEDADG